MSLEERVSTLESKVEQTGTVEDIGECPLCKIEKPPFWNGCSHLKLYRDIVRQYVLSKEGIERCTKYSHEKLGGIEQELDAIIKFFENAIMQTSYFDYHSMMYGVCDVDGDRPREVIRLLTDKGMMEFILKRYYDHTVDQIQKYGRQTHELTFYNDLQLFKGPVYLTKLRVTYENCLEILKQLDLVWLHSLNPDDYDLRSKMPEFNKRHVGFLLDNITSNTTLEKARKPFEEWKMKAEQELGKKLVYKNFGEMSN